MIWKPWVHVVNLRILYIDIQTKVLTVYGLIDTTDIFDNWR